MSAPLRIVVLGAAGRMGRELLQAVAAHPACALHAAVARPHQELPPGTPRAASLEAALEGADVLIDFTRPETTAAAAALAASRGVALVVGTTGLTLEHHAALRAASAQVPTLWAPNMSLGVNAMLWLLQAAATALGEGFDLELTEAHHRHKADAPSGTALRMLEVLAEARGWPLDEVLCHGRQGQVGARPARQIGVQVVRGGDVAGEHTALFLGDGERLEITHRASSRAVFAQGAARAAAWIGAQPPGLYTMEQVLGLKK